MFKDSPFNTDCNNFVNNNSNNNSSNRGIVIYFIGDKGFATN